MICILEGQYQKLGNLTRLCRCSNFYHQPPAPRPADGLFRFPGRFFAQPSNELFPYTAQQQTGSNYLQKMTGKWGFVFASKKHSTFVFRFYSPFRWIFDFPILLCCHSSSFAGHLGFSTFPLLTSELSLILHLATSSPNFRYFFV